MTSAFERGVMHTYSKNQSQVEVKVVEKSDQFVDVT